MPVRSWKDWMGKLGTVCPGETDPCHLERQKLPWSGQWSVKFRGFGCGRGCPPPIGGGVCPLPRKFLGFHPPKDDILLHFLHFWTSLNLYSLTVTAFSVTINIISFRIHISYGTIHNKTSSLFSTVTQSNHIPFTSSKVGLRSTHSNRTSSWNFDSSP